MIGDNTEHSLLLFIKCETLHNTVHEVVRIILIPVLLGKEQLVNGSDLIFPELALLLLGFTYLIFAGYTVSLCRYSNSPLLRQKLSPTAECTDIDIDNLCISIQAWKLLVIENLLAGTAAFKVRIYQSTNSKACFMVPLGKEALNIF